MTMPHQEQPVVFTCQGEHLVGVFAKPAPGNVRGDIGLLVIVGGPQYRVGSHRQFLSLSRSLADQGVPVLRFDVRGMGDSTGSLHTFEQIAPDIAAAIDALQSHAQHVRRIVLWGLCDGASAALLYSEATGDERVHGVCMFNPWVRSDTSLARAHVKHYYADRLRQREFWAKLLCGKVALSAVSGLLRNLRLMTKGNSGNAVVASQLPFQHRMAHAWRSFSNHILLVLSENDYTAKEFLEYVGSEATWADLMAPGAGWTRRDVAQADHTFSSAALRSQVEQLTLAWLIEQ